MRLPLLDRGPELERLRAFVSRTEGSLAVLYGRRRCGKSRLLQAVLPPERSVYVVADERDSSLQRASLAREVGRKVEGFERATYPDWGALLETLWERAPRGTVLAVDEFPALVAAAPEVPSVLQRLVDRQAAGGPHLVLAGSSQRMMQGLVLDRSAPLFGRAREILEVKPLPAGWIGDALGLGDAVRAVQAFAVWGGIPRYWELAAEYPDLDAAVEALVLSPHGVLHDEPATLLLDDMREVAQAASVLSLVGQGCHRLSEIAGRLGKPSTSLSRPLQRLVGLGLVRRELPYGTTTRDTKRSAYRVDDPFLAFWFRFVEPNRSRLAAGQVGAVAREVRATSPHHAAAVFERLVRDSVGRVDYFGRTWRVAAPWWGAGSDRRPLEVDVVAETVERDALLLGEVKWSARPDAARIVADLRSKSARLPFTQGRRTYLGVWSQTPPRRSTGEVGFFGAADVLSGLR